MDTPPIETIGPSEPDAPNPPPLPPDDSADHDDVEELAEAYDFEENGRKWLKAVAVLLEHRGQDSESYVAPRVRYAIDDLVIAACERGARILRSDCPPIENLPTNRTS